MPQHFLLSSSAKSLGLMDVMCMSEDEAWQIMREARWQDTGGEAVCPRCGNDACYTIRTRRQFRCKACGRTFSVTSGTALEHRKLPLSMFLLAVLIFGNAVKGLSALQLSRDLQVHYRTAFRLAHLLREGLLARRDETPMSGEIEVDGGYVGGYVRPANRKDDREDRRSAEKPDKRCIIAVRERGEVGAKRTLTHVVKAENAADAVDIVTGAVTAQAVVHTDEHPSYDALGAWFRMKRVSHSEMYSAGDGADINQAESFFSRFRRLEKGQVHHVSPKYLDLYANEVAYREDTRRWKNGLIFFDIVAKALAVSVQDRWRNYGRHLVRNSITSAAPLPAAA